MLKNITLADALVETIRVVMAERPSAELYRAAARSLKQAGEFCRMMADRLDAAPDPHAVSGVHATAELTYEPLPETRQ